MTRWSDDKMIRWPYRPDEQMTRWLNDHIDQMTILTKWPYWPYGHTDQMTRRPYWPYDQMIRWQEEQMTIWRYWPNDHITILIRWPFLSNDQMTILTRWPDDHIDKMTRWPYWQDDQMTRWQGYQLIRWPSWQDHKIYDDLTIVMYRNIIKTSVNYCLQKCHHCTQSWHVISHTTYNDDIWWSDHSDV